MNNLKLLTKTTTSDIFLNEEGRILKVLNEVGLKDELSGLSFLKACQGRKSCVKLYEFSENSMTMEFLPGENLYQFSKVNQEDKATDVFIQVIKEIQIPFDQLDEEVKEGLVDFRTLFPILEKVQFPPDLERARTKAISLSKELLETQTDDVLLHGDLHHENIKARENGEFACYDPKGYFGDPSYELGTTLKNPWDYPEISHSKDWLTRRAMAFSIGLNLPIERILGFTFVHVCLSIAWAIEDGCNFNHQNEVLKVLEDVYNSEKPRLRGQ